MWKLIEGSKPIQLIVISACTLLAISVISVDGQISTPCTISMISSFTPCLNFVTGSTNNGSAPSTGCCGSLKSIMSSGMGCACLLVTANVPFQLPINRTLAISLPRACNIPGVPLQCKSAGSPLPAPGPAFLNAPSIPPPAASPFSPQASKVAATASAPEYGTTEELTPAFSPAESEVPTNPVEIRPVVNPTASTSSLSCVFPSSVLQIIIGIIVIFMYY
ncbi:hypothetical protein UlMin_031459 [Ulmus minor]